MKITSFSWLSILLMIFSCDKSSESEVPVTETIKSVKYGTVAYSNSAKIRSYSGTTQAASEFKLSFRTGGLVTELKTDVGQSVKKGQLLAILDQTDIQLTYDKALATEQSANIQLETVKAKLDRTKQLYLSNSTSLDDYENEKNNYATAISNHESAKKSLILQQSQFDYAKIIAPASGVISEVNIKTNEYAQAGATIFVFNADNSKMEANIGVPENQITKIKVGQKVNVVVGGLALQGIITGVSFSTAGASTYPVIVNLGKNKAIRPGMPCRVSFDLNDKSSTTRLIAPTKSISESADGYFAYVLQKNTTDNYYTAEKRSLQLGSINDKGFVVISGLKEGDLVATAGLRSIFDGMKLKLINE